MTISGSSHLPDSPVRSSRARDCEEPSPRQDQSPVLGDYVRGPYPDARDFESPRCQDQSPVLGDYVRGPYPDARDYESPRCQDQSPVLGDYVRGTYPDARDFQSPRCQDQSPVLGDYVRGTYPESPRCQEESPVPGYDSEPYPDYRDSWTPAFPEDPVLEYPSPDPQPRRYKDESPVLGQPFQDPKPRRYLEENPASGYPLAELQAESSDYYHEDPVLESFRDPYPDARDFESPRYQEESPVLGHTLPDPESPRYPEEDQSLGYLLPERQAESSDYYQDQQPVLGSFGGPADQASEYYDESSYPGSPSEYSDNTAVWVSLIPCLDTIPDHPEYAVLNSLADKLCTLYTGDELNVKRALLLLMRREVSALPSTSRCRIPVLVQGQELIAVDKRFRDTLRLCRQKWSNSWGKLLRAKVPDVLQRFLRAEMRTYVRWPTDVPKYRRPPYYQDKRTAFVSETCGHQSRSEIRHKSGRRYASEDARVASYERAFQRRRSASSPAELRQMDSPLQPGEEKQAAVQHSTVNSTTKSDPRKTSATKRRARLERRLEALDSPEPAGQQRQGISPTYEQPIEKEASVRTRSPVQKCGTGKRGARLERRVAALEQREPTCSAELREATPQAVEQKGHQSRKGTRIQPQRHPSEPTNTKTASRHTSEDCASGTVTSRSVSVKARVSAAKPVTGSVKAKSRSSSVGTQTVSSTKPSTPAAITGVNVANSKTESPSSSVDKTTTRSRSSSVKVGGKYAHIKSKIDNGKSRPAATGISSSLRRSMSSPVSKTPVPPKVGEQKPAAVVMKAKSTPVAESNGTTEACKATRGEKHRPATGRPRDAPARQRDVTPSGDSSRNRPADDLSRTLIGENGTRVYVAGQGKLVIISGGGTEVIDIHKQNHELDADVKAMFYQVSNTQNALVPYQPLPPITTSEAVPDTEYFTIDAVGIAMNVAFANLKAQAENMKTPAHTQVANFTVRVQTPTPQPSSTDQSRAVRFTTVSPDLISYSPEPTVASFLLHSGSLRSPRDIIKSPKLMLLDGSQETPRSYVKTPDMAKLVSDESLGSLLAPGPRPSRSFLEFQALEKKLEGLYGENKEDSEMAKLAQVPSDETQEEIPKLVPVPPDEAKKAMPLLSKVELITPSPENEDVCAGVRKKPKRVMSPLSLPVMNLKYISDFPDTSFYGPDVEYRESPRGSTNVMTVKDPAPASQSESDESLTNLQGDGPAPVYKEPLIVTEKTPYRVPELADPLDPISESPEPVTPRGDKVADALKEVKTALAEVEVRPGGLAFEIPKTPEVDENNNALMDGPPSTNEVVIDGRPVSTAPLEDGDTVSMILQILKDLVSQLNYDYPTNAAKAATNIAVEDAQKVNLDAEDKAQYASEDHPAGDAFSGLEGRNFSDSDARDVTAILNDVLDVVATEDIEDSTPVNADDIYQEHFEDGWESGSSVRTSSVRDEKILVSDSNLAAHIPVDDTLEIQQAPAGNVEDADTIAVKNMAKKPILTAEKTEPKPLDDATSAEKIGSAEITADDSTKEAGGAGMRSAKPTTSELYKLVIYSETEYPWAADLIELVPGGLADKATSHRDAKTSQKLAAAATSEGRTRSASSHLLSSLLTDDVADRAQSPAVDTMDALLEGLLDSMQDDEEPEENDMAALIPGPTTGGLEGFLGGLLNVVKKDDEVRPWAGGAKIHRSKKNTELVTEEESENRELESKTVIMSSKQDRKKPSSDPTTHLQAHKNLSDEDAAVSEEDVESPFRAMANLAAGVDSKGVGVSQDVPENAEEFEAQTGTTRKQQEATVTSVVNGTLDDVPQEMQSAIDDMKQYLTHLDTMHSEYLSEEDATVSSLMKDALAGASKEVENLAARRTEDGGLSAVSEEETDRLVSEDSVTTELLQRPTISSAGDITDVTKHSAAVEDTENPAIFNEAEKRTEENHKLLPETVPASSQAERKKASKVAPEKEQVEIVESSGCRWSTSCLPCGPRIRRKHQVHPAPKSRVSSPKSRGSSPDSEIAEPCMNRNNNARSTSTRVQVRVSDRRPVSRGMLPPLVAEPKDPHYSDDLMSASPLDPISPPADLRPDYHYSSTTWGLSKSRSAADDLLAKMNSGYSILSSQNGHKVNTLKAKHEPLPNLTETPWKKRPAVPEDVTLMTELAGRSGLSRVDERLLSDTPPLPPSGSDLRGAKYSRLDSIPQDAGSRPVLKRAESLYVGEESEEAVRRRRKLKLLQLNRRRAGNVTKSDEQLEKTEVEKGTEIVVQEEPRPEPVVKKAIAFEILNDPAEVRRGRRRVRQSGTRVTNESVTPTLPILPTPPTRPAPPTVLKGNAVRRHRVKQPAMSPGAPGGSIQRAARPVRPGTPALVKRGTRTVTPMPVSNNYTHRPTGRFNYWSVLHNKRAGPYQCKENEVITLEAAHDTQPDLVHVYLRSPREKGEHDGYQNQTKESTPKRRFKPSTSLGKNLLTDLADKEAEYLGMVRKPRSPTQDDWKDD